ncbi:DNA invertase Pin-like site-specific DNA recombinase [Pontibacter mucosus]|uniref:DNA invertase Pin-like site-specific DNA recombinase n=1 Tax=Pontibacter mucosus TaxID=1649266 RepID=A0A2T5YDU3_9BACT|nr:recombinase family protein [Pontibacter mucosus]PTX14700.1 DNA invertase Pin-like site-specific DNA recombinase [Pontibacter mucosus]
MNKVALLVRKSTADQSHDRQISELQEFATNKNFKIVEIITETVSGAKKNSEREGIQRLVKLAETKKINKVAIHEVTRLGRATNHVLDTLEKLHSCGVSVVVMNYNLETLNPDGSVNPMAQFLFTILTDIGRMERLTLIERVKSGLAEAKRKGKVLGRPRASVKDKSKMLNEYKHVVKYLHNGYTIRETAKLCDVGISTVQRVKKIL